MTLDPRSLRAFLGVVDGGSLGRAATALGLAQPTLSRVIQGMEARLGQPLFDRQSKGMFLTAAGELLVPHARAVLFEAEQATAALDALRGLGQGVARIGAVAAVARSILPPAVGAVLAGSPGLRIEMMEAPDERLIAALIGREIDLMVAAEIPPHPEISTVAECRFDDEYSVFGAADHPLALRESVTLAEALAERWIMPGAATTPRLLFEALVARATDLTPTIAVETGSIGVMVSFVGHTRLLGWLPRPLLRAEEAGGSIRLLAVHELSVRRRFFLYRRTRGMLPPAAQRLRECMPLLR